MLGNCGGSCAPCVNQTNATVHLVPAMAVCETPDLEGVHGDDVSWVNEERQTGKLRWGCLDDSMVSRGFEVGELGFAWSVHWAAFDSVSANDVVVTAVGIDGVTGDVYVGARTNKTTNFGLVPPNGESLDRQLHDCTLVGNHLCSRC